MNPPLHHIIIEDFFDICPLVVPTVRPSFIRLFVQLLSIQNDTTPAQSTEQAIHRPRMSNFQRLVPAFLAVTAGEYF